MEDVAIEEIKEKFRSLEKEMQLLKNELFEARKIQEIKSGSLDNQISSLKDRVDGVMMEMKLRNTELGERIERYVSAQEKTQTNLITNLERITHKVENVSSGFLSTTERQAFFKEEIEKMKDDISHIKDEVSTISKDLSSKIEKENEKITNKVAKLEKAYYTATGAILLAVPLLELAVDFFIK